MTLARLLAAALVVCSLHAFAQDQQSQSSRSFTLLVESHAVGPNVVEGALPFDLRSDVKATPTQPWRILPSQPRSVDSGQNALDPARLDQYRLDQIKNDPNFRHLKLSALDADTTCYAIRSYVVARDSKDSDATHATGYSTCQPSNRFQLKSADLRVVSDDH